MAKITIELDTSNDEDAALAAKLFAGAPPRLGDATPFPPIQPSADGPTVEDCMAKFNVARNYGIDPATGESTTAVYFGTMGLRDAPEVSVGTSDYTLPAPLPGVREAAAQGAREALAHPTPPAPPAPAGQTQELDAAGLPWDARIHSESRAQIADGTWRRKRGVDQALVDRVTVELRAAYPISSAPLPPAAPAIVVTQVTGTDAVDSPLVPPPPAAPVIAPPPPAVTPAVRGVPDLAAAVARGTLSLADLNAACLLHGCANVLELNKNPAALTAVCAQFDAIGAFNS